MADPGQPSQGEEFAPACIGQEQQETEGLEGAAPEGIGVAVQEDGIFGAPIAEWEVGGLDRDIDHE
eukprot:2409771-Heterocapsa_arctica.AAC.1